MKTEIDAYAAFVRQRRSLLIVSAVLAVYHAMHPEIDRIGVAGIYIELAERERAVLIVILWLVWAYLLYRFHVYRRILADKNLREVIDKNIDDAASAEAWKRVSEAFPGNVPKRLLNRSITRIKARQHKVRDKTRGEISVHSSIEYIDSGKHTFTDGEPIVTAFDGKESRQLRKRAKLDAYWSTPHATEYWLPYVIASVAAAIGAWDILRLPIIAFAHAVLHF
jgi:hypothetical protein